MAAEKIRREQIRQVENRLYTPFSSFYLANSSKHASLLYGGIQAVILLLCYCECFELCVTSVTAVTRHNIFVFPPRKYIVHQMFVRNVHSTTAIESMKSCAQSGTGTHDALRPACPTSSVFSPLLMTLLQEGNFKEIFKTDEGNFVQNKEKL